MSTRLEGYRTRVKLEKSLIIDRLAFSHCRWPVIQTTLASRQKLTCLQDYAEWVDYDKTPILDTEIIAAKRASVLWTDTYPHFKVQEELDEEELAQATKEVYGLDPAQELYYMHFRAMVTPVKGATTAGKFCACVLPNQNSLPQLCKLSLTSTFQAVHNHQMPSCLQMGGVWPHLLKPA